ncbi:MAG: tetratricopeptide repeat protein [Bryobacteraceae bacterium]
MIAALLLAACHMDATPAAPEAMRKPIALDWKAGRSHEKATGDQQAQDYHDQGLAYLDSHAFVEAARSFQEALRLAPSTPLTLLRLSEAYRGAGFAPESAAYVEQATTAAERSPRARLWVEADRLAEQRAGASGKQRRRLNELSQRAIDALVETDSGDGRARIARGDSLEGAAAIAEYRAAAKLDSKSPGAHHRLAHALMDAGDFEAAIEAVRAYQAAAPHWPHGAHLLGHLMPLVGKWTEAREGLESIAEKDAHGLTLLAAMRARDGDRTGAEPLAAEACRLGRCAGLLTFLLEGARFDEVLEAAAAARSSTLREERCAAETSAGFALIEKPVEGDPRRAFKSARLVCKDGPGRIDLELLGALLETRSGKAKNLEPRILSLVEEAVRRPEWEHWVPLLSYYTHAILHAGHGEIAAEVETRLTSIDSGRTGQP